MTVTAAQPAEARGGSLDVLRLAVCQAMLMTGVSLVIASSALVGARLAPNPALATLPLSLQYVTTMLVLTPVSYLMRRWGRRPVFVWGATVGAAGMVLAAFGIHAGAFALFALAGIPIGVHNAVGQFYRFAAADAVAPSLRSRAISLTLAGGVLAAFLGPNLARLTRDALAPSFTASFLALVATTTLAALIAAGLRVPPPAPAQAPAETIARPLGEIARQPAFVVALAAGMIGYGEMNLLMTSTPLAMHALHQDFGATVMVIQWHVVAMYAPSFLTGDLIRRCGIVPILALGALLEGTAAGIALSGTSTWHFLAALVCLGVGWNFLYVGATTLLGETHRPVEKARVQGLNDTLVFTTVTLSSLASAGLVARLGWHAVSLSALAPIALLLALVVWFGTVRARTLVPRAAER